MTYTRLRDLREDSDKTQADVAKYLGTTAQYYGKYEKGERELPFARAIELAELYDVSLDYIAGRTQIQARNVEVLNEDSLNVATQYQGLSERNKGKLELFLSQLLRNNQERC